MDDVVMLDSESQATRRLLMLDSESQATGTTGVA